MIESFTISQADLSAIISLAALLDEKDLTGPIEELERARALLRRCKAIHDAMPCELTVWRPCELTVRRP